MKKAVLILLAALLLLTLAACAPEKTETNTVFDLIRESPAARLELPDGRSVLVDGEIASLRGLSDMRFDEVNLYYEEDAWLYKIVFNPSEKVQNAPEIPVYFYKTYLKIENSCYYPSGKASYSGVLDWVEGKFAYFMK